MNESGKLVLATKRLMCAVPPHPQLLQRMWRSRPPLAQRRRGIAGIAQQLIGTISGGGIVSLPTLRPRGLGDGYIYPIDYPLGKQLESQGAAPLQAGPRMLRVIVVLVSFSDQAISRDAGHFHDLFFSTGGTVPTGSVREYYEEISRGAVVLSGDIIGPYVLGNTGAYYANKQSGRGLSQPNIQTMAQDLLSKIGPRAYAQYDNNGDGFVDAFI